MPRRAGTSPGALEVVVEEIGRVVIRPDGDAVVAEMAGEIDASNVDAMRAQLGTVAPDGELVIDLRPVTFLGSSGISLLVAVALRRAQPATVLVADGSSVDKVLELSGVDGALRVRRVRHADEPGHGAVTPR